MKVAPRSSGPKLSGFDKRTANAECLRAVDVAVEFIANHLAVIFHQARQIIFDFVTGEIPFQARPADFEDGDIAALCPALTF